MAQETIDLWRSKSMKDAMYSLDKTRRKARKRRLLAKSKAIDIDLFIDEIDDLRGITVEAKRIEREEEWQI